MCITGCRRCGREIVFYTALTLAGFVTAFLKRYKGIKKHDKISHFWSTSCLKAPAKPAITDFLVTWGQQETSSEHNTDIGVHSVLKAVWDMKRTRHSSSRAGRAMIMRIFFTSSLMKFTSSLSDLSVDYTAAKKNRYKISVFQSQV